MPEGNMGKPLTLCYHKARASQEHMLAVTLLLTVQPIAFDCTIWHSCMLVDILLLCSVPLAAGKLAAARTDDFSAGDMKLQLQSSYDRLTNRA